LISDCYWPVTREAPDVSFITSAIQLSVRERAEAIVLLPAPSFGHDASQIADLANQKHLPTLFFSTDSVRAGGLVSYGPIAVDRRAAYFVERILKGAGPADMPAEQPTKFDLAINLKTAKALGVTVPTPLLARADEVIE
jgi:putative ABC transport system substrate-binding protein